MSLCEDDISNLSPLFPRGINTGRVVRTSVQEENRAFRGGLEGVDEWLVGEPDRFGVVVRVGEEGSSVAGLPGECFICLPILPSGCRELSILKV
jgi:hypothetical protein